MIFFCFRLFFFKFLIVDKSGAGMKKEGCRSDSEKEMRCWSPPGGIRKKNLCHEDNAHLVAMTQKPLFRKIPCLVRCCAVIIILKLLIILIKGPEFSFCTEL